MNVLGRAFAEAYRENSIMPDLGAAIDLAIFPFKSGKITAYVSDFIASGRTLEVCVERLPNYNFVMSLDVPSIVNSPNGGLDKIYAKVFHHFRYRPSLPVEEHIVLGED